MRRRIVWTAVLATLIAGIVWLISLPQPTGSAEGSHLEGEIAPAKALKSDSFRVGTFNIHGCTGLDGRRDIDRVATSLKDLDIAALNEVHGPRLWESENQAALLGQKLGIAWLFAPATRDWHQVDFGNGVLSKLPVESWQRMPLVAGSARGYRNALLVRLRHQQQIINVLLTHIARSDDETRKRQIHQVIELYLALSEPAVLLGDLNSEVVEPEIQRLLAAPGVIDALEQKLGPHCPPRIDFIFVRGLRVRDAGLRDEGASDHPLVWADLATQVGTTLREALPELRNRRL
jgi:endonuclease/exonuclease/phosphatase family metal-dependent hydrolase